MKTKVLLLAIIFSMGTISGVSIFFMSKFYTKTLEQNEVQLSNDISYTRIMRIDEIDNSTKLIRATLLDRKVGTQRNVVFSVTEETTIERQDPILKNDVIVGASSIIPLSLENLSVGDEILVRLGAQADGALYARHIIHGTPFPRL